MNDIKQYYVDGSIKSHFDNKIYKEWRPDGSLKIEVPYNEYGTRYDGIWKLWNRNVLKTTKTYVNGRVYGDVCQYNSNGILASKTFMKQNSGGFLIKDGESMTYDKEGRLLTQCTFCDDILHGEYKKWNSDGELLEHKTYNNGVEL